MTGPPEPPDTDNLPDTDLPDWDFSRVSGARPARPGEEALPWRDADFARISENARPLPPAPAEARVPAWRRIVGAWTVPSLPRPALPRVRLPRLQLPRLRMPRPRLPRPQLSWPALPTFRLPRVPLPRVALPRPGLPRVPLPRLQLPRLQLPRMRLPHLPLPQMRLPRVRLAAPRLPRLPVLRFHVHVPRFPRPRLAASGFPRLRRPRFRISQPRLPQPPRLRLSRRHRLRVPHLQLSRPPLPYPQFPRPPFPGPGLPHLAWRAPAHHLALRAGGLRRAVALQGRRAGAGAARTADRAAARVFRAAGAARGVSALTAPETRRYWQSGSLASIGLCLGLVAAMSAADLWRAPGEAPMVNYVEGTPVPAVIRPFSDVELAQLRPVPVPLPRVAYRPPSRLASRSVAAPAAIDVDVLPSRLMLPVAERRAFPLDRAATAEAQVRLIRLGYAPGAPTGRLSVRTRQAIALFQKNAGLDVTGAIDTSTIELLRRASAS